RARETSIDERISEEAEEARILNSSRSFMASTEKEWMSWRSHAPKTRHEITDTPHSPRAILAPLWCVV
ncbi:hypothetical protein PENTCL1PPCAC_5841, partial [Pristionchus entomophagus]